MSPKVYTTSVAVQHPQILVSISIDHGRCGDVENLIKCVLKLENSLGPEAVGNYSQGSIAYLDRVQRQRATRHESRVGFLHFN